MTSPGDSEHHASAGELVIFVHKNLFWQKKSAPFEAVYSMRNYMTGNSALVDAVFQSLSSLELGILACSNLDFLTGFRIATSAGGAL